MLLDVVASVPLILVALSAARGVLLYFKDKVFKEVVLGIASGIRWACFGFYYFWAVIIVFICCGPVDYVVNGPKNLHSFTGEVLGEYFDTRVPAEVIGFSVGAIVGVVWFCLGLAHLLEQ